MKRISAFILALMIVFGGTAVFGAEGLTRREVCEMLLIAADDYNPGVKREDILKGYGNGDLGEDKTVTRAEALVMLDRAFGGMPELKGSNERLAVKGEEFEDIPEWAGEELRDVIDAGIAAGTGDGRLLPDEYVTKEQMERFITRTYSVFGTNEKDDFYAAVNKEALESSVIGKGKSETGTMAELNDRVNGQISKIVGEIVKGNPARGSREYKIKAMYENILDYDSRNAAGYEPIKPYIDMADHIANMEDFIEFNQVIQDELGIGILLFGLGIDPEDSNRYITTFEFPAATFDLDVYSGENEKLRNAYYKYIASLLILCGESAVDANRHGEEILRLEKSLAECEKENGIEDYFNEYTLDEIDRVFLQADIKKVFEGSGLNGSEKILADAPECMERVGELFVNDNIEVVREYAKVILIDCYAEYFGFDFINAINDFIGEVYGIEGNSSAGYGAAEEIMVYLGDYIGELYGERYCSKKTIDEVTAIVEEVIDVYRDRINGLDWMGDDTKAEALNKLNTMKIKVGMPTKTESFLDNAEIRSGAEGGSYFDNVVEITLAERKYILGLEGTAVDRDRWVMYPHTVNAAYSLQMNDINLPAAVLQKPLYGSDFSYEEKLGTIGFIVGHEITHAFDDSGCRFDEFGNMREWWSEEDYAKFEELCQDVIDFYAGSEYAQGIAIDPELTLGENIADLGAMACITEIGSRHEGFDFKKMFESYGRMWYSAATRESLEMAAESDVHSNANIRVNKVLQSSGIFAEVYGLTPMDGMYVPDGERVTVW